MHFDPYTPARDRQRRHSKREHGVKRPFRRVLSLAGEALAEVYHFRQVVGMTGVPPYTINVAVAIRGDGQCFLGSHVQQTVYGSRQIGYTASVGKAIRSLATKETGQFVRRGEDHGLGNTFARCKVEANMAFLYLCERIAEKW